MNNFIILTKNNDFDYQESISNAEFLVDIIEDNYNLTVLLPSDEFDIKQIDQWAIDLFDIQLTDIITIKNIVESNTSLKIEYASDVNIEDIRSFNVIVKPFNELTDHTNKFVQPYNTWVWNNEYGHWNPPVEKPNLSIAMRSKWSDDWENWKIEFGQSNVSRSRKAFQLWLSSETDGSSMFVDACSTNDYMIKPFENITHGTRQIENLIKSYNDSIAANSEMIRPYMSITGHIVVIDLSPIAIITYSECHSDAESMFSELYSMHPQFFARTAHELFRLIIEWAYSHTDLNNNELTAITSHNILRAVQMPKNIRNGLLDMQPQQVGKFILNDENALIESNVAPESPIGFDKWVNTLYYHYPHVLSGQPSHIDILPDAYPV